MSALELCRCGVPKLDHDGDGADHWAHLATRDRRRADEACELLIALARWAESPSVRQLEAYAFAHGIMYQAEDVAIWNDLRAFLAKHRKDGELL